MKVYYKQTYFFADGLLNNSVEYYTSKPAHYHATSSFIDMETELAKAKRGTKESGIAAIIPFTPAVAFECFLRQEDAEQYRRTEIDAMTGKENKADSLSVPYEWATSSQPGYYMQAKSWEQFGYARIARGDVFAYERDNLLVLVDSPAATPLAGNGYRPESAAWKLIAAATEQGKEVYFFNHFWHTIRRYAPAKAV